MLESIFTVLLGGFFHIHGQIDIYFPGVWDVEYQGFRAILLLAVCSLNGIKLSFLGQRGSNDHRKIKFTLQKCASGFTWNASLVLKVKGHV